MKVPDIIVSVNGKKMHNVRTVSEVVFGAK